MSTAEKIIPKTVIKPQTDSTAGRFLGIQFLYFCVSQRDLDESGKRNSGNNLAAWNGLSLGARNSFTKMRREHVVHTSMHIPAIVYSHGSVALRYRVDLL